MKPPIFLIATLFFFNVISCGGPLPEEDFSDTWASNWCGRAKRCDPSFVDRWDNKAACVADMTDVADIWLGLGTLFCDYDPASGRQCIRAVNEGNCADFLDYAPETDLQCSLCG